MIQHSHILKEFSFGSAIHSALANIFQGLKKKKTITQKEKFRILAVDLLFIVFKCIVNATPIILN